MRNPLLWSLSAHVRKRFVDSEWACDTEMAGNKWKNAVLFSWLNFIKESVRVYQDRKADNYKIDIKLGSMYVYH